MLTPEIQASARRSVLCWLATVDASGQPHVSPKEIFAIFDEHHVVVANIASPGSARNIASHPQVCLSFVDVFVQKGFKLLGRARNVLPQDADFANWASTLEVMAGPRFSLRSVFVIEVLATEPILAPSYRLFPGEVDEASQIKAALKRYGVALLAEPSLQSQAGGAV